MRKNTPPLPPEGYKPDKKPKKPKATKKKFVATKRNELFRHIKPRDK